MTALDDLEAVVILACTVEDRCPQEQRALLRVAMKVEAERNKSTTRNIAERVKRGDLTANVLVDTVEYDQDVKLPKADREKVDRRRASFVREITERPPR